MKMSEGFFQLGPASDRAYVNVRDSDSPWMVEAREFCEELWKEFHPNADRNFISAAKNNFHQRFWEMYLGVTLLRKGYQLENKTCDRGPDFCFMVKKKRVWVEAIAPGRGDGPDAVPDQTTPGEVYELPREQIFLRYTHALAEKFKIYKDYINNGIVGADDCFIIAVNGRAVLRVPSHAVGSAPLWVRAFLPFGDLVIEFDKETLNWVDTYSEYNDSVNKINSKSISTAPLLDSEYGGISGVLHSAIDCANHPNELGADFEYLHNPLSLQPLGDTVFGFCTQFFFSEDSLRTIEPHSENSC